MGHLVILIVHLITTVLRVARPGGVRAVIAESVLAKHQLLILNRSRRRAPNLRVLDRLIAGFCSLWITSKRVHSEILLMRQSAFGITHDNVLASDKVSTPPVWIPDF
jgi:hypothetical protein